MISRQLIKRFHSSFAQTVVEDMSRPDKLFRSTSSAELMWSYSMLKSCQVKPISIGGPKLLRLLETAGLGTPAYFGVKHTFFSYFCGGESASECVSSIDRLKRDGVGAIFDYSVEGGGANDAVISKTEQTIIHTIELSAKHRGNAPGFSCLKVSAFCEESLLQHMSELLTWRNVKKLEGYSFLGSGEHITTLHPDRSPAFAQQQAPSPLSPAELAQYEKMMMRLRNICKTARDLNVPILFDAEHTHIQPAIDHVALQMAAEFNTQEPVVYNTYQMYLRDSLGRLGQDLEWSKKLGIKFAAKLVRGAYMNWERNRAKNIGVPDPIQPTIHDTHTSYDSASELMLNSSLTSGSAVLVATHNKDSVVAGVRTMDRLGIRPNTPLVSFAQLYGMGNSLSLSLGLNGINAAKYLPFGPIRDVMPYLTRRLEENSDILGGSASELQMIQKELRRRVVPLPSQGC